jgi:hypothetical protein
MIAKSGSTITQFDLMPGGSAVRRGLSFCDAASDILCCECHVRSSKKCAKMCSHSKRCATQECVECTAPCAAGVSMVAQSDSAIAQFTLLH